MCVCAFVDYTFNIKEFQMRRINSKVLFLKQRFSFIGVDITKNISTRDLLKQFLPWKFCGKLKNWESRQNHIPHSFDNTSYWWFSFNECKYREFQTEISQRNRIKLFETILFCLLYSEKCLVTFWFIRYHVWRRRMFSKEIRCCNVGGSIIQRVEW